MGLQLSTRNQIQSELMRLVFDSGVARRGRGRNLLCPRIHFSTRSEVPHRFATFHPKRGSTRTYVSSRLIVEPPRRGAEPTASIHTLFNMKRFHMGLLQFSTQSKHFNLNLCVYPANTK